MISHSAKATPGLRYGRSLVLAFLAALVVRLIVVAFVYQGFLDPGRDHWEFGYEMGKIARSIATGRGFGNPYWATTGPTALITPVYPYLFAGILKLFGINTKAAALAILTLNSFISSITCVPIFFVARRSFGFRTAKWAAWTWAFYPFAIFFSAVSMWYQSLIALLLVLLLLIATHLQSSPSLWAWAGFGALFGLAALTNPVVLSIVPFLGGWACYRLFRQGSNWILPASTATLALVITVTPWLIRNYRTFHQAVFLKDNFWMEICVGNLGDDIHWWHGSVQPSGSAADMAEFQRRGELGYMAEKKRQALAFIENYPGTYIWLSVRRAVFMWTGFWSFRPEYLREEPFDPANIFFCTGFALLLTMGLRKALSNAPDVVVPYALLLLTYPVVYYLTHPDLSYRHPLDPEIVILAAYAMPSRQSFSKGEKPNGLSPEETVPLRPRVATQHNCVWPASSSPRGRNPTRQT